MEDVLRDIKSQLADQTLILSEFKEKIKQLEQDNAALKKALGFRISAASSTSKSGGSGEMATVKLRQINLKSNETQGNTSGKNRRVESNRSERSSEDRLQDEALGICTAEDLKRLNEEYVAKEIRSATIDEEKEWVKENFNELRVDQGTTTVSEESVEKIIATFRSKTTASGAIKLSNYLNINLEGPLWYATTGCASKKWLPVWIIAGNSEAICFDGWKNDRVFICSYEITTARLRITIFYETYQDKYSQLGLGFSPASVLMDESVYSNLTQNSFVPFDWTMTGRSSTELELLANHGKFCARAHWIPGSDSLVHVEILESTLEDTISVAFNPLNFQPPSLIWYYLRKFVDLISFSEQISCVMKVANGLNVSLKVRAYKAFESSGMSAEVSPLAVETFVANGKICIEAVIIYEIESTDLGLIVAAKAQKTQNKFAIAFLPMKDFIIDSEVEKLLDQNQWGCLLKNEFYSAKDGEQTIQTRNIRTRVSMTECRNCHLQIQVYTV